MDIKIRKVLNMKSKHSLFIHLFILLFTVSVSVTIFPCYDTYTSGLFGEVRSSVVSEDDNFLEELDKQDYVKSNNKGINIINIWYELWCIIVCMIFILYITRLPRGDTIVTLKVRMDH